MRSGSIAQTTLNYTGQRRDDAGLLYYNARYYDPAIGRFISADSVVPGGGPLTTVNGDTTERAAWGQGGGGPANPQNLNRYAYGLNNPVKNTDPTGHCIFAGIDTLICIAVATEVVEGVALFVGGTLLIGTAVVAGDEMGRAQRAEEQKPLAPPAGTQVEKKPSEKAARRAAERDAGIGKHGAKTERRKIPLNKGSKSPVGDPGVRTEWDNPENGATVHQDPYGNYYPETDEGIGPHYGVELPDGTTRHYTYPSHHDPRNNR